MTKEDIKNILDEKYPNSDLNEIVATEMAEKNFSEEEKTDQQNKITLYTTEYETTAERYENIYKAIWQNFSYMSVVAGAILTFGSNFYPNAALIAFLSCIPLLFWYFATFIPMNRYGYRTASRLSEIEKFLNEMSGAKLGHYTNFARKKFLHPRVGPIMFIVFSTLICFAVYFGGKYFSENSSLIGPTEIIVKEPLVRLIITQPSPPASVEGNAQVPEIKLDQMVQSKLSDTTKKLLDDYRNAKIPSRELQRNLAYDFNKVIEGRPLCAKDQNNFYPCNEPAIAELFNKAEAPEDLLSANRLVLEKAFPGYITPSDKSGNSLIGPKTQQIFKWLILGAVFLFIGWFWFYELYIQFIDSIWQKFKNWRKENTEVINLVSLSTDSENNIVKQKTPLENRNELDKLMGHKNIQLLTQILDSKEVSDLKWRMTQKSSPVMVFVEENGKAKLIQLNYEKLKAKWGIQ